jgi:hypothetical protein
MKENKIKEKERTDITQQVKHRPKRQVSEGKENCFHSKHNT